MNALIRSRLPIATAHEAMTTGRPYGGDDARAAGADGWFIAKEVGGDSVDLIKLFDLHTRVIFESAVRLLQSGEEL